MNEAVAQLTRGLDLLKTLPETPEGRHRELGLEVGLGAALSAAKGPGAPETARAYARAHELCAGLGAHPNILPALQGRFSVHFQRAELAVALEVARELLRRAEEWGDAVAQVIGHRLAGAALYHLGEFTEGRAHFETGLALYDPGRDRTAAVDYAIDARVICASWLAHSLLVLGYPEQALARIDEALAWANTLAHPNTVAHALMVACILHGRLGPGSEARTTAERLVTFATEQGFAGPAAVGTVVAGWALADGEPVEEGIARTAQGLKEYRATGGELWVPDFLALRAQMHGWVGQPAAGLNLVVEALDRTGRTGGRHLDAELHRLRGELLLALPGRNTSEAEACFRRALAVARGQGARMWELRAATSLAHLLRDQSNPVEAHDLLTPIYGWFTEGFNTPDLKDAKMLLEELALEPHCSRVRTRRRSAAPVNNPG
jgi:predicted ATPase